MPARFALLAGATANAIGNTLGFHVVTGSAVRARIYLRHGLTRTEVVRVVSLSSMRRARADSAVVPGNSPTHSRWKWHEHHQPCGSAGIPSDGAVLAASDVAAFGGPASPEDATNELGTLARLTLQRAQFDAHAWCDEDADAHAKVNAALKAGATLLEIDPVTASAVTTRESSANSCLK